MTLDDVEPIFAHWRKLPPLRTLAAAWLGFKPPEETPQRYMSADDMRRLMQMTGGRIDGIETR